MQGQNVLFKIMNFVRHFATSMNYSKYLYMNLPVLRLICNKIILLIVLILQVITHLLKTVLVGFARRFATYFGTGGIHIYQ